MPTKTETDALNAIERMTEVDDLRTVMKNAKEKSEIVEKAAFDRLVVLLSGQEADEAAARDCWQMIFAVEEIRRLEGRKVSRMNRLRPKIDREGIIPAIEYCVRNKTEGFDEIVSYGREDLLAEMIVLRHPDTFSQEVRDIATKRLEEHDIRIN